ncbi:kynurenine--oxoglutarate transaminase 1 [Dorcoceras hygrometricum]|uniref:Kynurenine--oxoglutarate transaminase 1 n=1 Tax=Dorcoceras hygrometricum TaxID=472368 RepID=A0A2Z7BQD5_9LAMI|nr:kynurenine--oxoglutarate transaminase 1 [Dorcoceras hygrometricum]
MRSVVANHGPGSNPSTCVTLNGSGIQLAVGPQPLRLRNHNFGLAQRIMVKRLATSRHDPLGITDSACKNQLVVVSVHYGTFNTYIPIRSTTIGKSRVARDPIAIHLGDRIVTSRDIHACKRAVNPRQRIIDSYMHRDLTQSRRLMTPSASLNLGRPYPHFDGPIEQRIMVKRLATSRHDPLGITDSACKNQLVVVSIHYGTFNTYIPIRSTTIGKSRVARDPIAIHLGDRIVTSRV